MILGALRSCTMTARRGGLDIHFYSRRELDGLCADFEYVVPPCEQMTKRDGPKTGTWSQWEIILQKR